MARFREAVPPKRVHRVSFTEDPLALRPRGLPRRAGDLGGRFDDPEGRYRVLYTATSRVGAYLEKLSEYQIDLPTLAIIQRVLQDAPDIAAATIASYITPEAREFPDRYVAELEVSGGRFASIAGARGLQVLRDRVAARLAEVGVAVDDVHLGNVLGDDRQLTQLISRLVYEDREGFSGLAVPSSLGVNHTNYIVFERVDDDPIVRPATVVVPRRVERVSAQDPALERALLTLEISTPGLSEILGLDLKRTRSHTRQVSRNPELEP